MMLEGKVAVVTGAGGGIGREIALAMALAGAKVVVNDIGASLTGEGETSATPGQQTVGIIQQRGGEVRRGQRVDVRVTAAGREALTAATPALTHLGRPETLGLSAEEAGTLHGLLERVLSAIATDPGPGA